MHAAIAPGAYSRTAHADPDTDNFSQIRDLGFAGPEQCAGILSAMDATRIAVSGLQAASQRFSAAASNVVAGTSLGQAVRGALRRFATGIYLIWYPIKSDAAARAFEGEVRMDVRKALKIVAAIDAPEGKLARAGVLVVNPPFGFATAMEGALAKVAPRLKAETRLEWLAGEE